MKYICGPDSLEIDISLPEGRNKKILFAISGGADSAILLYLLAKLDRDLGTDHSFILFTVPRPDGGANYSPAIVDWINNKLGTKLLKPMIYGNGFLPHNIVVKTAIKNLMGTGKFDMLYVAENKIPDGSLPGESPVRASTDKFNKAMLPFWKLTKDYTIDLYYREGVKELLTLSHSCTERVTGRCLHCFQCKERAWAFSQLGKTDPGTL